MAAERSLETLGTFIDGRYAPWALEHVGDDAAAGLKADFADWLTEPLTTISAPRIESWRRDQLSSLGQPLLVTRKLLALESCLNKAVEWQLIERNPLQDVSLEADVERVVEVCTGGVGHACLRDGWAPIGGEWTWTLGKRASIEWPPVGDDADFALKVDIAGVFNGNPQRLIVTVNETTVGILLCRGPAAFEFFVPARALESHGRIEVVLKIPDARRPMDLEGGTDNRFLGLRIARLHLRPLPRRQPRKPRQAPGDDDLPDMLGQRAAVQDMASLGLNCEFGFVQRHLGAEPMSLFRWGFIPIDKLTAGLERQFEGLSARDALDVQVNPEGEIVVEDKVYGFRYHTFVYDAQGGMLERVRRNEYVRIGVLCKTLLQELREQTKLFVYHDAGASPLEAVRKLLAALRSYGDNTLLWIVAAPSAAQVGEARLIEPGLIQGYVSGFQGTPIAPRSPHVASWIKVACRAHRIWASAGKSPPQPGLTVPATSASPQPGAA